MMVVSCGASGRRRGRAPARRATVPTAGWRSGSNGPVPRGTDRRGPMTSVPGVDHPVEQTEAEVTLTGRGISVSARVEVVQNEFVSVRPSVSEFVDQVVVKVGDVVELFWKTDDAQRALPAEVTAIDQGAVIRWRLRATGPAEES